MLKRSLSLTLLLGLAGTCLAQAAPVPTPDGRYVCYQGGLTSSGSYYWGYFDLAGNAYLPFTGTGGDVTRESAELLSFSGGIFERYDWVGVLRLRDDDTTEVVLLERADLQAFLEGSDTGKGSGYVVYCGWDGVR